MKLSKTKEQVSRVLDNETIILNLNTSVYYTLNPSGTAVWNLINGKNTPEVIINKIADAYGIVKQRAGKDVEELIDDFKKEGLVQ
jgi:hypothetical protein